jgi:hypothetical protein
MKQVLAIFGPLPAGSNSAFTGFCLVVVALLGLLSIPSQIAKMYSLKLNSPKVWSKLAIQLVVLVAFLVGGLMMLSKRL